MDLSTTVTALGKYLTDKVVDGAKAITKKVTSGIDEGRALGKQMTDMLRDDLQVVKNLDGTDEDKKKLDQLNIFKYMKNLAKDFGEDLTNKKNMNDFIITPKAKGNMILIAVVALSFSPAAPFMLLGLTGILLGKGLFKSIKNLMKSLKAAFPERQNNKPFKSGPPSIDNGTGPTGPSIKNGVAPTTGPTIKNAANPTPPVNTNTQTSLGQNNVLRSTFANAAQKLAAGSKTAPALGSQPMHVKAPKFGRI